MSIQDLSNLIKVGHGEFRDDPQSGSILKLLGDNGFRAKIEAGATTGHTYTIIHNPPSTEFLLVDTWNEGEHPRKAYHAFSVRPHPVSLRETTLSSIEERVPEPEHPMISYLKDLNKQADQLLTQIQKYA